MEKKKRRTSLWKRERKRRQEKSRCDNSDFAIYLDGKIISEAIRDRAQEVLASYQSSSHRDSR